MLDVTSYGAVGDGTTNDTAAINAAITAANAAKCELFFPAGTYLYDGGGLLTQGVTIRGEGQYSSFIKSRLASPTNGYLINCNGYGASVRDMGFNANVKQTGGSYVVLSNYENVLQNFHITGDFNGILMNGNCAKVLNGRMLAGATNAIRIRSEGQNGFNDHSQVIDNVIIGAQDTEDVACGIRVRSIALTISNTSVIKQNIGLRIDPSAANESVYSLFVHDCFFDTCANTGIAVVPTGGGMVKRCRFANSWASSSGNNGVFLNTEASESVINGLYFDSFHACANRGSGFSINYQCKNISINGGIIADNNQWGLYSGPVDGLKVQNADIGAFGGFSANTYGGVALINGAISLMITGNNMNDSIKISDLSTTTIKTITNNNLI